MTCPVPRGRHPGPLDGMGRSRLALSLTIALSALGTLTACGGGEGDGAAPSSTTTTAATARPDFLAADVQVRAADITFPQKTFSAQAGDVTVGYVNQGNIFHSLVLQTADGQDVAGWRRLELASEGDLDVATVTLGAGEYVLFCDVAGHRAAGMEARLRVAE